MSAVDLLQPILEGGVQRNNFFNGRLLSAEDLQAEQAATRAQFALLARAQGEGVAWGLSVSELSAAAPRPRIAVTKGLALNRFGDLLHLHEDTEVTLVPEQKARLVEAGLFAECEPPRATASLTGEGAYVLTLAPSSGFSGTALVSDPNTTAIGRGTCGARFTVEGVRFRLVPIEFDQLERSSSPLRALVPALLAQSGAATRERTRNLLAHACFGTDELAAYFANPLRLDADSRPYWERWGLLDAMRRRNDLTRCDVPLAIVVLNSAGISFVDMWSARRRLVDAAAIHAWRGVAGPRRVAESEAAFLQFQSQLEIVRTLPSVNAATVQAQTYFEVLPAAGRLPIGSGGFNWAVFLQAHAPPAVTQVDEALLRGIIERSWFLDPFRLATSPPVPLNVFQVPGEQYVVFARSTRGAIRVQLGTVPSGAVDATATAATGIATKSAPSAGGQITIPELAPGTYTVDINAAGYQQTTLSAVAVVGGRTTARTAALTPLPNGWIMVTARDRRTSANIGDEVTRIEAERNGVVYSGARQADKRWKIANLPAGNYTVRGSATGYTDAASVTAAVSLNQETPKTLTFDAVTVASREPDRCERTRIRRPAIGRVELCMVIDATEFDQTYYYGDRGMTAARGWKSSDFFSIAGRTQSRKTSRVQRYVSEEGVLLFDEEPWRDMQEVLQDDRTIQAWLRAWRGWFMEMLQLDLRRIEPAVYIDAKYQVPGSPAQVPERPQAYAVYGVFAVPLEIRPLDIATRAEVDIADHVDRRGVRKQVFEKYADAKIRHVNDLAFSWVERIVDIGGELVNPVRHQIYNALDAAKKVNDARAYIEGMDDDVRGILEANNIRDDVALANADPQLLTELLGSASFAVGLIDQARDVVPRESWSLEGLGFSPEQTRIAAERGIESIGVLTGMMASPEGRQEVAGSLNLVTGSADALDNTLNALELNAITTMTLHSVALAPERTVASLESIDAVTSMRIAEADIVTAEELAALDAAALAEKAGITVAAAELAVNEARTVSGSAMAIGSIAGANLVVSAGGGVTAETAAGTFLNLTDDARAAAVGGDAARAGAVVAGLNAGLALRGAGLH